MNSELKKSLNSFVALQNIYIQLVEVLTMRKLYQITSV